MIWKSLSLQIVWWCQVELVFCSKDWESSGQVAHQMVTYSDLGQKDWTLKSFIVKLAQSSPLDLSPAQIRHQSSQSFDVANQAYCSVFLVLLWISNHDWWDWSMTITRRELSVPTQTKYLSWPWVISSTSLKSLDCLPNMYVSWKDLSYLSREQSWVYSGWEELTHLRVWCVISL